MMNLYKEVLRSVLLMSRYGKKPLLFFGLLVTVQSLFNVVAVMSVTPLMLIIFKPTALETFEPLIALEDLLRVDFTITSVVGLFIIFQFVALVVNVSADGYKSRFIGRAGGLLQANIVRNILEQRYEDFSNRDKALTARVIGEDVHKFISFVFGPGLDLVAKISIVAFLSIFLLVSYADKVIFLVLGGVVYYLIVYSSLSKLRKSLSDRQEKYTRYIVQTSTHILRNLKLIKIHGKRDFFMDGVDKASEQLAHCRALIPVIQALPRYIMEFLAFSGIAGVACYLVLNTNDYMVELATLGVIAFGGIKMLPHLQALYSLATLINANAYVIDAIELQLDLEDKTSELDEEIITFEKNVEILGVQFQYDGAPSRMSYPDIRIEKGDVIGVCGLSGTGKSTLIDVLLGLLEPTKGRIEVDGKVITKSNLNSWRAKIGYVGQQIEFVEGSLAENIAYGFERKDIDLELVKKCASIAHLDNFVESLTEKYNTRIDEYGAKFSGGQLQRLAIARAFYREPNILVFDEATSSLDAETERKILEIVYGLPKDITVIMITHRVETLNQADRVINLN